VIFKKIWDVLKKNTLSVVTSDKKIRNANKKKFHHFFLAAQLIFNHNVVNNSKCLLSIKCDTEDWSNNAGNSALHQE